MPQAQLPDIARRSLQPGLDARQYKTGLPAMKPAAALTVGWLNWMPELNMRADLTLKCWTRTEIDGHRLPVRCRDEDTVATVVRAMNRLNRYVLKNERRNRRLSAVAFMERGPKSNRPHIHALIERPANISVQDFARWLRKAWTDQPFGHRQMRIEPIRSQAASWFYDAKGGIQGMVYFHKDNNEQKEHN